MAQSDNVLWWNNLKRRIINAQTFDEKLKVLTKANATIDDYKCAGILVNLATEYNFWDMLELMLPHRLLQGSSFERKSLEYLHCANANNCLLNSVCPKRGLLHCSACFLVAYCSKNCQKEHWIQHKKYCKSQFASPNWKPGWILQQRQPQFFTRNEFIIGNIFKIYVWGNTPAFDLMRWECNETQILTESDLYDKPISMAFIGSSDFRNVIETLASIPENIVTSPLRILINDKDPIIVARNLLMLLALQYHGVEAIDAVLQVWYSTRLTIEQFYFLNNIIRDVAKKCQSFSDDPLVLCKSDRKTFAINLYQAKQVLITLFQMVSKNSSDVDAVSSERLNALFDCDPGRSDKRDSFLLHLKPHQRVAWNYFREDGIFLPLSAYSYYFTMNNKFIMNPNYPGWPMSDCSDPMDGWDMRKVDEFAKINKLPKSDVIGSLYFYVRDRLLKAVATLERLPVQVDLFCNDACDLAKTLSSRVDVEKFDRIDASNLADDSYVGISRLLSDWEPLLNEKNENSVLVTLFMNWFLGTHDTLFVDNERRELSDCCCSAKLSEAFDRVAEHNFSALCALKDDSKKFEDFLAGKMRAFKNLSVTPRREHKIVPHRLLAPIEAPENYTFRDTSDEESYFVIGGITKYTLRERYVEWAFHK